MVPMSPQILLYIHVVKGGRGWEAPTCGAAAATWLGLLTASLVDESCYLVPRGAPHLNISTGKVESLRLRFFNLRGNMSRTSIRVLAFAHLEGRGG